MPEKRMTARAEEAQETISDENEAAEFQESFENEVLFHGLGAAERARYRLFVIG